MVRAVAGCGGLFSAAAGATASLGGGAGLALVLAVSSNLLWVGLCPNVWQESRQGDVVAG
jgi:hypothetical protein